MGGGGAAPAHDGPAPVWVDPIMTNYKLID